jgi:thioesterase domain-containing protein
MSAESFNRFVIEAILPHVDRMGIRVVELRPGYVEAHAPMDGNGNHLGTMYAGTLFAIAEMLGGAIALASFDGTKVYPVVKDLRISYRRPARTGVTARASMTEAQIAEIAATVDANGRAPFSLVAQLFDDDGDLVAETDGNYQLRAHGN